MNKYKLFFNFIDGSYTCVDYKSDNSYQDEFLLQSKIISKNEWYSCGNNKTKQSINLNNVKYWTLEQK